MCAIAILSVSPLGIPSDTRNPANHIVPVVPRFAPNTHAIAAVLGANIGTTGTIWLAGVFVSDGMPKGDTLRIAMAHTGVNMFMALTLLPFVHPIARFLTRF